MWWEPVWLALLGPSLLFPGRFWVMEWQPALVLLCLLFWPVRRWATGRWYPAFPGHPGLALLLCSMAISLAISIEPLRSWAAIGPLVWGMACFVMLLHWPPVQRHPGWIGVTLIGLGVALALLAPLLLNRPPATKVFELPYTLFDWGYFGRMVGESANPNVLAGSLVLLWPLALARVAGRADRWPFRLVYLVAALLIGAAIVFTQSRGAYLAMAAASGVVLVGRWPRAGLTLLVGSSVLGLLLLGLEGNLLRAVLASVRLDPDLARVALWERALWALRDFPLTGVGFGLFYPYVLQLYPYLDTSYGAQPHAHNLPLQIGVDLGTPGLVAMMILWLATLGMGVRLMRNISQVGGTETAAVWALGSMAGIVAMVTHGLVDAVTWSAKVVVLPWLLMALISCLYLNTYTSDTSVFVIDRG